MKNNEQKTKELFLIAMNAVKVMNKVIDKLTSIGFDIDRDPVAMLCTESDRIIHQINEALELKINIHGETTVNWWYDYFLTGKGAVVITNDKKTMVNTTEQLWELMRENGEV